MQNILMTCWLSGERSLPFGLLVKPLTIFCGCTARLVRDLVGGPEDRFLMTQLICSEIPFPVKMTFALGVQHSLSPKLILLKYKIMTPN